MTKRTSDVELFGVHLAVNIFVGATLLWVVVRGHERIEPIWAISSMIAASEPRVEDAVKFFRGRLINASIGCATGLFILFVGRTSEWKIPLALSVSVLISNYLVRIPVMWRQAPITATIVVASGLMDPSRMMGARQGLRRVVDVLLGCVVGLLVTYIMSKLWPMPPLPREVEGKQKGG